MHPGFVSTKHGNPRVVNEETKRDDFDGSVFLGMKQRKQVIKVKRCSSDGRTRLLILFLFILTGAVYTASLRAQDNPGSPSGNFVQYESLSQSIESALSAEKENAEQIKEQLSQAKQIQKDIQPELNAYKIQISAYSNLLLLPSIETENLEKALSDQKTALDNIAAHLKELEPQKQDIEQLLQTTTEQYTINQKQLTEIKKLKSDSSIMGTLVKQLNSLMDLLSKKRDLLNQSDRIYTQMIDQLQETQSSFQSLSEKFGKQIKEIQQKNLFQKKAGPLRVLGWEPIREELRYSIDQVRLLITKDFWLRQFRQIWKSGGFLLITSVVLFGIVQFLLFRLQQLCTYLGNRISLKQYPWRCFTLKLFQRSLPLLGAATFFYVYAQLGLFYSFPFVRMIVHILLILLFCGWASDFLMLWNREKDLKIPEHFTSLLRFLLILIRIFAISYVVTAWVIGNDGVILLLERVLFEMILIAWSILFWKRFRAQTLESFWIKFRFLAVLRYGIITWGYIVGFGGFLPELAGYGQFALYWYTSWGRTFIVFLWGGLFFFILREWDQEVGISSDAERSGFSETAHPIWWFLVKLSWVVWMGIFLIGCLLAWGAKQSVIIEFFRILNSPLPLGEVQLRLMGIVYAVMILFFTHMATRLWKLLLRKKVLIHSGIELGLRESITTISAYLLWAFGIVASLNALGIGTTSLTVAFGALGIGLGFGLQNIFNNFISGIILLFERPIQVGDVVEIQGTWGTVKKINVRSTVVQTYDNASLIIPNSEFVSTQLKNWSFKDTRVRRSISVGVAYGSDTELVRQTLIDIADRHPNVLKYPKPDVLFSDFADSALVFNLRIWSTVDHYLRVETDIRFEIDRLFREKKIEISFPQRDLHIRSMSPDIRFKIHSED